MPKTKRKTSKEAELESLVFGLDVPGSIPHGPSASAGNVCTEPDDEEEEEEIGFSVDKKGDDEDKIQKKQDRGAKKRATPQVAWHDEDDEDVKVDLHSRDRLKKLQKVDESGKLQAKDRIVSGKHLSELLAERFQTREYDWAKVDATDDDNNGEENEYDALLRNSESFIKTSKRSRKEEIASGLIDITRVYDANRSENSQKQVTSCEFYSDSMTLLVASLDKHLRLFNIDGEKNEKLSAVKFQDMPLNKATFAGNTGNIVCGGRKPYFYVYDCVGGNVTKHDCLRHHKQLKSHENFAVSPTGSNYAFVGRGGYVHIVDGKSKLWHCDLKSNSAVRAAVFSDETTLFTAGLDAEVYMWDLRMAGSGRCVSRFKHDDGSCIKALSVSSGADSFGGYLCVGSESGAMSVFNTNDIPSEASDVCKPLKTSLNLTTTVDSISMHPSNSIVAFGSSEVNDQLRLMHLPSCTVFTNWPTQRTPLRKIQALDFSCNGMWLAAANDRGKVLLYKINHFNPKNF